MEKIEKNIEEASSELDTNCFACGAKVDHDDPNLEIRKNNHVVCCSEGYSGVSDAELESMGAGYMDADEFARFSGLTEGQMMRAEREFCCTDPYCCNCGGAI